MRACAPVLGGPSPDLKDRVEGAERWKTMTLAASQFIRRFLIHVLPKGLQRIRHYGLLANGNRGKSIERARELLAMPKPEPQQAPTAPVDDAGPRIWPTPCLCCGARLFVIEFFAHGSTPRHHERHAPLHDRAALAHGRRRRPVFSCAPRHENWLPRGRGD
jgi:hypothetical protein